MLAIDALTYRLGTRLLFDAASAVLPAGARVGFVGRNGIGKTTLFCLISEEIEAESGEIGRPKKARLGRVEQEAPGGPTKLVDFVLAADLERSALLDEALHATDPTRIADIQTRLADIDAHSAPARAAIILHGLGFDASAQKRPLSEFSGGWRMRVALAAVLFSAPDILLLDEPTNYLDLEGTIWLTQHLATYPATMLVISHDRDLLDDVCDHILHLDRGKLTLWKGDYTSFERQRREAQVIEQKAAKKQADHRQRLEAFVERFKAKATKARQAQSRMKVLAKMEVISISGDQEVLPISLPSPERPLSPPIVAMDEASVGYDERIVLSGLDLSLSHDDRIGLLGSNGNGKSTFAKLIAGRLKERSGKVVRAPKLDVGFFAQHQVDEFDPDDTAVKAIARLAPNASESQKRGHAARFGLPGPRAETPVSNLSGGEKARLLLGLATFHRPHLLILDEPTNHLDIDSRAALIEAINDYSGAVIIVSHDRRILEACVDRLWVVSGGSVRDYDGDLDDYRRFILDGDTPRNAKAREAKKNPPEERMTKAEKRDARPMKPAAKLQELEERIKKFSTLLERIDKALAEPNAFAGDRKKVAHFGKQRSELASALASAEDEWLALSTETESA